MNLAGGSLSQAGRAGCAWESRLLVHFWNMPGLRDPHPQAWDPISMSKCTTVRVKVSEQPPLHLLFQLWPLQSLSKLDQHPVVANSVSDEAALASSPVKWESRNTPHINLTGNPGDQRIP